MSESHSHSPTPQEESEAKLLAYVEGELDEAGRAEIERHLESNPNHRRLLEELKVGRDLLRWVPREPAPPELMESFQSQLERAVLLEEEDEDAAEEAGTLRINPWHQFRAVAAVLVLATMLGLVVLFALPQPQNRDMALHKDVPVTGEAAADGAAGDRSEDAPAAPMAAPPEPDASGTLERQAPPTRADTPERRMAKGGPAEPDGDTNFSGRGIAENASRGKVGPSDSRAGPSGEDVAAAGKADSAPGQLPLASARDAFAELERANNEVMTNTVRNLANAQAVQLAIERNAVARPRGGAAAKAGPAPGAYAEPLYVVVNTSDPDQARRQITQYLHLNGIRNVEVLDQTLAALQSPDRETGDVNRGAAPAFQDAGKPLAEAEARIRGEKDKANIEPGVARAPNEQMKKEPSRDQAKAGPQPPPDAVVQGRGPARGEEEGIAQKQQDGAQAGQRAGQQPSQQQQVVRLEQQQQQAYPPDDVQRIERVLVARGMNRRQAVALQQNLNKPTEAQWVGVYDQPADLRRDARGGSGEQDTGGQVRGGRAYDQTAGAPAPAPPAAVPSPAVPSPAAPQPAAPPAPSAGDPGSAAPRGPVSPVPNPQRTATAAPATRPSGAPPAGAGGRDERSVVRGGGRSGDRYRNPATQPAAPAVVAQRPSSTASPAPRAGIQQGQPGAPSVADKNAPARPATPTAGSGAGQSVRPADSGRMERTPAAEQVVTGQPTSRPAAAPGGAATAPAAEKPDYAKLNDEDRPLDVVIVLQRAPLSGGQYAREPYAPPPAAAEPSQPPANNAAPATSPAATTRPAR